MRKDEDEKIQYLLKQNKEDSLVKMPAQDLIDAKNLVVSKVNDQSIALAQSKMKLLELQQKKKELMM